MTDQKGRIRFNELSPVKLGHRRKLQEFIRNQINAENKNLISLDFIFCSDEYLLTINQKYLNHDDFTDIITFNLSEVKISISGEVYISVDRIKENSETFQTTFEMELHRVIFHGVLHLCGYTDKTTSDKALMRKKEDEYLHRFFK